MLVAVTGEQMKHIGTTFRDHDFSHQDLQTTVFEQCHFYNCKFDHADLRDAVFLECKFIEVQAITGCSFNYASLQDASFTSCMLAMSTFNGANCLGIEMRKCDMKGVNFFRANFANRVSQSAYFCSAYITGCNLSYANFEQVTLEKCELFENRWNEANLSRASLAGSDLSRGEFTPDMWGSFNLEHCDLTHVELEGLDVRKVSLLGVKICDWQQEQLLSPFGLIVI